MILNVNFCNKQKEGQHKEHLAAEQVLLMLIIHVGFTLMHFNHFNTYNVFYLSVFLNAGLLLVVQYITLWY